MRKLLLIIVLMLVVGLSGCEETTEKLELEVAYLQAIVCKNGHKFIRIKTETIFSKTDVDYFVIEKCEVCGKMQRRLKF